MDLATYKTHRNINLGTTGDIVCASPGRITGLIVSNRSNAEKFLKLYNKATVPTQADEPNITIPLPIGVATTLPPIMIPFSAGISMRATTGIADSDTGAPGSNEVVVNVIYE